MKMGLVEKLLATSSLESKKDASKFLERFDVDITENCDNFSIVDKSGAIYHEVPEDILVENGVSDIVEAIKVCLNDCDEYYEDDDPSWVDTIEAMKFFWTTV